MNLIPCQVVNQGPRNNFNDLETPSIVRNRLLTASLCDDRHTVFFFMCTKVFIHLTHLKLPQISKTYLKIFVWSGHLIKIHLELFEKYF